MLLLKHYEQGVLHKAAKCVVNEILENISKTLQTNHFVRSNTSFVSQMRIWKLFQKHYE